MINLSASTLADIEQISEWAAIDPYHYLSSDPGWWMTGQGFLSFCLMDSEGPLCFVRLDAEQSLIRLHTQFGPQEIVSKKRLIVGMLAAFGVMIPYLIECGFLGIVTNTVSPPLIKWLQSQNFDLDKNDDYVLRFELENTVDRTPIQIPASN